MDALSAKRVVSGLMVGAAVVGLCSCSSNTNATDPTAPGPMTSVEQTVSPSPSPSPAGPFVVRTATKDDRPAYSDGYVPSDEPQGAGE